MNEPFDVEISGPEIRLGQFLKLANIAESGAQAKLILGDGMVTVNGAVETRRGSHLHPGDVVAIDTLRFRVTRDTAPDTQE